MMLFKQNALPITGVTLSLTLIIIVATTFLAAPQAVCRSNLVIPESLARRVLHSTLHSRVGSRSTGSTKPFHVPNEDVGSVRHQPLRVSDVLKLNEPQASFRANLKDDLFYLTALAYGGHSNQVISIGKLLYLGKLLNRVVINPTLIPFYPNATPLPFSAFYDLPRFFAETSIPSIDMHTVKPPKSSGNTSLERVSCWSSQELVAGHANLFTASLAEHDVEVDFWPLPPLERGLGGADIAFDALKIFDFNRDSRNAWIEKVQKEALPQRSEVSIFENTDGEDNTSTQKQGFNTVESSPPDENFLCLDNALFLGSIMFPTIHFGEQTALHETEVPGDDLAWRDVTQHIHFTQLVEEHADEYLMKLFDVSLPRLIPPFITVHMRRGDFKEFTGLTSLYRYKDAVRRVRRKLRIKAGEPPYDEPLRYRGRRDLRYRQRSTSIYDTIAVLATTDEETGSPFIDQVRALGWKVLDHGEFNTAQVHGGWWPTILDSAVLARGIGFVGTAKSTYSHLAGLRVKYWNGGVVDVAV